MKKALLFALLVLSVLSLCVQALSASFDDDGLLRVVNRDSKITKNYVPELVIPDVPVNKKYQKEKIGMRPEAAHALEEMFKAAKAEKGYQLLAVSGYRAFSEQQLIFNNKVASVGSKEKAWRTVAPAGASEHQLGLAMDIVCDTFRNLNKGFSNTDEGKWLYENCQRFGFIVRYKAEWQEITGYAAEPWHFRYIGVSHAMAVQMLDIPFEAYAEAIGEMPEYVLEKGCGLLLYSLAKDRLTGDGCYYEEICDSPFGDQETECRVLEEMTGYFLPEGFSLNAALTNEVPLYAFTAR